MYQMPLPTHITQMTDEQAVVNIYRCKAQLADRLVILGHHYQRDEIIQFADFTGDSLKLSQRAAEQDKADYIVFCGVHFMAESADILTSDEQIVLLPDMTAGCSMADMADLDQVEEAWQTLQEQLAQPEKLVPVTYVNSSADIKAFCGKHNGYCCTSSNCRAIFEAIWSQQPDAVILFLPDEHLGRNTAFEMGVALESMPIYDPFEPLGAIDEGQYRSAKVVLWKGFCSVHGEFTVEQIEKARAEEPDIHVIVHPECSFDVVQMADDSGSTSKIVQVINAAPNGSSWIVGTEINLVNRLAEELKEKHIKVRSLSGKACPCSTMYRIDLPHLAWIMENVVRHSQDPSSKLPNRIVVPEETKKYARLSLEKMMHVSESAAPSST